MRTEHYLLKLKIAHLIDDNFSFWANNGLEIQC